MHNNYYVYMLTTKRNTALYTGVTNDLYRRVLEHKSGLNKGFTSKYNCHKLVYYEKYSNIDQAIAREKTIKEYSRLKKNALIEKMNPNWVDLMEV